MSNSFNPNQKYSDKEYTITGVALNQIGKQILGLQAEVKELKDNEMQSELNALRLRDKNPAVKDAWDKYQTVLGLATN